MRILAIYLEAQLKKTKKIILSNDQIININPDNIEDEFKINSKEDENLITIIKQNIKDNELNLSNFKGDINKLLSLFISCEFLKNITSIILEDNDIGAEGMNHLSKCTFLSNLLFHKLILFKFDKKVHFER